MDFNSGALKMSKPSHSPTPSEVVSTIFPEALQKQVAYTVLWCANFTCRDEPFIETNGSLDIVKTTEAECKANFRGLSLGSGFRVWRLTLHCPVVPVDEVSGGSVDNFLTFEIHLRICANMCSPTQLSPFA